MGMPGKHFFFLHHKKIIFKSARVKDTFSKKKVVNTDDFAEYCVKEVMKLCETISKAEVGEKWDQKRFRVWSIRDELRVLASGGDCQTCI